MFSYNFFIVVFFSLFSFRTPSSTQPTKIKKRYIKFDNVLNNNCNNNNNNKRQSKSQTELESESNSNQIESNPIPGASLPMSDGVLNSQLAGTGAGGNAANSSLMQLDPTYYLSNRMSYNTSNSLAPKLAFSCDLAGPLVNRTGIEGLSN